MPTFAFLMLDGSMPPQLVLVTCAFGPAIAILLSWLLLRISRKLLVPAVFIALLSGLSIIASAEFPRSHEVTLDDFGITYVIAIYTAATFPLLATLAFYIDARVRNRNGKTTTESNTTPS